MKVDSPEMMRSVAPMRVKRASTGESVREDAGAWHPICARIAVTHVVRSSVDLPPCTHAAPQVTILVPDVDISDFSGIRCIICGVVTLKNNYLLG